MVPSMIILLDSGESLSPFDLRDTAARLGLTPIFITSSDIGQKYARIIGARTVRTETFLNTPTPVGSIIVTEQPVGILAALRLSIPVFFHANREELCEMCSLIFPKEAFGRLLIPYLSGRADGIVAPRIFPHEYPQLKKKLRDDIGAKLDGLLN